MASKRKAPTKSRKAVAKRALPTRTPPCFDDPERMAQRDFRVCVYAVSKDLRDGVIRRVKMPGDGPFECATPACRTLKIVHRLAIPAIIPHEDCDSPLSIQLQIDQAKGTGPEGALLVDHLVTLFDRDGLHRGIHAGNFLWRGPNALRIRGRMSGTTNAGLYRAPVFDDIEHCSAVHVLYGRLCGRIETIDARGLSQLLGSQLIGTYRIALRVDPREGEGGIPRAPLEGVFEGAILAPCKR